MAVDAVDAVLGPWMPGIKSTIPRRYMPLATIFRPENITTSFADIEELSGFTGVAVERLPEFRPERLIVHELLIRVMAELTVPDGDSSGDLGINFRGMSAAILEGFVKPRMVELKTFHRQFLDDVAMRIEQAMEAAFARPEQSEPPPETGILARMPWRRPSERRDVRPATQEELALSALARWDRIARESEDEMERACCKALGWAAAAVISRQGYLPRSGELMVRLAAGQVSNTLGSELLGAQLDPIFQAAVDALGYRRLPPQQRPVILNTKGASASGKSTMRPLQRRLSGEIGTRWEDFALIAPDIWRKFLLDYAALGEARRYAGSLTAHEVEIIDRKLDRHMSRIAGMGRMPHLLIDRFRFDSFVRDGSDDDDSHLLTRFGQVVYMFFMITPPEETVVRAWYRGERVGRYKAVDDLLAHNIEAYTGFPGLFFRWALSRDKRVHFEFLDNDVPEGERPRTVAFGGNDRLTILDVDRFLDIDRFRKINIEAKRPEQVYPGGSEMSPLKNVEFLNQCLRRIAVVDIAHFETGEILARVEAGRLTYWRADGLASAIGDAGVRLALARSVGEPQGDVRVDGAAAPPILSAKAMQTLGRWGPA